MTRGLVIGKFYPPHLGHSHLIETALKSSERVTVLVCDWSAHRIPASLRASWIQELYPAADVRTIPDIGKDDDSPAWAEHTKQFLGWTPDVVYSSEDYGTTYAQSLGCRHVLVDKARQAVPISASQVRSDPWKAWAYLSPAVRAYFARRVAVMGAESTGTTTLTKALAEHYQTVWAPEFGRLYSEGIWTSSDRSSWQSEEFSFIAKAQNQLEDQLARRCNKILFCDTNSFATQLWHERYLGRLSEEVSVLASGRRYDIVLLTDVDIPFVQDGLRDGEHIRSAMHARFQEELAKQSIPVLTLSGSPADRLKKAVAACDQILQTPW